MAEALSIRDQLQADWDALSEPGGEPTPQAGAVSGDNGAQGAAGAETGAAAAADPEPAESQSGAPVRDEKGRFAPKTEEASTGATAQPQAQQESAPPAGEEPPTPSETIRPPPSLSAAVKAKFGSLDPDVQQAFVTLETSVQQAKAEWGRKGERLNRFEEILAPHVDRWRLNGLDEYSGVQALIAAQSMLDRDPVSGLIHVARSYGLTPAHLAQAFGLSQTSVSQPGGQGQVPGVDPSLEAALQTVLSPVLEQVRTLQQETAAQRQEREAVEVRQFANQIEAFATSDEAPYFDNVADDVMERVAAMRAQGQPAGIELVKKAYDAAVWANPDTRKVLLDEQARVRAAEDAKKTAEKAQREKAQRSAIAAGSVTGSPTPGSNAPPAPQGSVRDSLRQAAQEIGF